MKYEFLATLSFDDTDDLINTATSFVTGMINAGLNAGMLGAFFSADPAPEWRLDWASIAKQGDTASCVRELVARMDQDDLISILERAIATSASSVIGAHDADFKLTAMNAATKEITGYRKRDIRPIPEDDIRSLIAAKMNEVGKACIEAGPTANVEDFGYVQEWNNRKLITVGWYGDYVDVEVLAELLYGDEQFGPGKLGVSSAGQDGEVEASWLALINYVICSTDDSNTLRGIADTSENANAIKEWCESRGISVNIAALPPLG